MPKKTLELRSSLHAIYSKLAISNKRFDCKTKYAENCAKLFWTQVNDFIEGSSKRFCVRKHPRAPSVALA